LKHEDCINEVLTEGLFLQTLQKCFVEATAEGFVFNLTLQKCFKESIAEGFFSLSDLFLNTFFGVRELHFGIIRLKNHKEVGCQHI